ncbi:adhesion G-protein coupled receptor G6 [Anarhichas minor]|uniref:adhesion G-protein coupled receptor G6 n=1 Tax=Anarhichas minor TaxID=65739 RepID=UPI003F74096D
MASSETPSMSLRHGVRVQPNPCVPVEAVLLAVGDCVGHANLSYASRMNRGVLVFLKEERFVAQLIASGVSLNGVYLQVSPLAVPSTRVTVSGVPPFIPNQVLERELQRFGKLASSFRTVGLGCKSDKLKHVQSFRRQVFMFLTCPSHTLEVSFRVKHGEGHYMVYASTGSIKCFECGEVGHKRTACPHRPAEGPPNDGPAESAAPWGGDDPPTGAEAEEGLSGQTDIKVKRVIEDLENEIRDLEHSLFTHTSTDTHRLQQKKQQLGSFLQERAKGALVRSRFTSVRDMDAPTSYFFNLEKSVSQTKQMVCLRLPDGKMTTDPIEMRQHAVSFYSALFRKEDNHRESVDELLQDLPQLGPEDRAVLDANISLEELTAAVGQMAAGRAPGLDGLPADFYKHFWKCLGANLLVVLPPPQGLIKDIQRTVVDFFWSGLHWLRSAVLYLPVQEGGQGLVDIASRITAFRLQTAQRLLYSFGLPWTDTACVLLRRARRLGYDKHLFLLQAQSVDLTGLTPFYQSVLQAWRVFTVHRRAVTTPGMWLFEEPLFGSSYITSQVLTSVSLRSRLREAGCVKLGHLMKTSIPQLAELINIRSSRLLLRLVEEVCASLPAVLRAFVGDRTLSDQWDNECEYVFPPLAVCPAVGQWEDEEDILLSLKTPQLGDFETLGRKAAYQVSVKVSNLRSLAGVRVSRWTEFFGRGSSPRGCWRSLYKPPADKRTGDLQWRIVHGAIATNRYLVHLDPGSGDSCPFCSQTEIIHHLFVECSRLMGQIEAERLVVSLLALSGSSGGCPFVKVHEFILPPSPPALGCSSTNCNVVLTEAQGEFTSPCYPQKYPNSQACKWTMQAPAGFIIQLSFLDFDLEEAPGCIYDRVVVNTGNTDVKFCGPTASGLTLNSTGNVMELSFTSDFSVQKRGFSVSFRHVAVALRNQKVNISRGNGQFTEVSNSVTMPTLSQLTLCFEVERSSQKQREWIFSYYDGSGNEALSLGSDQSGMKVIVDGVVCPVDSIISSANFTSSMRPYCVLWTSSNGRVGVYFNGNYWAKTCSSSGGHSVPAGGQFRLGGQHSFDGNIYNLRLWDYAMTVQQLHALSCDTVGNVIDWDNSHWTIPSGSAQTDTTLSCICYPHCIHLTTAAPTSGVSPPSNTPLTTSCDSPALGCPEGLFYRVSLVVEDEATVLTHAGVERAVALWLNQTFQNWTHAVYVDSISVQSGLQSGGNPTSYSCRALLVHYYNTNESLGEAAVSARLSGSEGLMGAGLQVHEASTDVSLIENCPEENPLHYRWPESRPTVTRYLPCFPNKDQSTSRTCVIGPHNFSSYWSAADVNNCTDIDAIEVSAENAAEVAVQLAVITNNELSDEEVAKVVMKVKQLVNVAKINSTLASTVVTIISNVMSSSETALAATSEKALKTVDELVQKIEFEGPSISITSRHLAVGISTLNTSVFNGTSFSAFIPANTTDPQIDFQSERTHPLAQVSLPASLLSGVSLTEEGRSSLSRINFMFFSSTNLFQKEQDGRSLNSFVVASSVGNLTIRDLKDPVEIQIAHLSEHLQTHLIPVCMFWDFSMNSGAGGWNGDGCRTSAESTSNRTVCLCDHLTHFGILMDISGASPHIDPKNNKILTFISYIGCGVSAIFSAATLLTYIAFEKLRRDYPSKILMNLSTSLLFLNMVFLLDGWLASLETDWLCLSVAVFLHYFLLTTFTWMGLESIHMYIALVKVFNTYIRRYILKFCIVGWGLPAVLVGIVVAVDKSSYGLQEYGKGESGEGSSEFCWIQNSMVFYTTCVGYFCLVFLLNVAMFIVVMLQICGRNGKRSNRTLREEVLRNLRSVVSLTFLLGMTWGFALFSWGPVSLAFMYLFAIFNSLQGLFIFIFHCALKENVQKQWRRYLCCGRFRLSDNSDWSKTPTNNTKKVSSDNLGKSLSSSSFGSTTAHWTSKAKATLNPFTKRHSNTDKSYSNQTGPKCVSSCSSSSEAEPNSSSSSSSILPVSQMIDKVRGYCSTRSDNFYKNIIMSDSFAHSTRF